MRPKNIEKEQAIRTAALRIISEEGLENLSMQKLAKDAGISPRTIYIKYENKEDLLIKLFIEEVLDHYEEAVLEGFHADMDFAAGVRKLWINGFRYFRNNKPAFRLMQYGRSSPLLNRAYQQKDIKEGDYFAPIETFLTKQVKEGKIHRFPHDVHRALLFSPLFDLVNEYFDYLERPKQIITERIILSCCDAVIRGMMK